MLACGLDSPGVPATQAWRTEPLENLQTGSAQHNALLAQKMEAPLCGLLVAPRLLGRGPEREEVLR